LLLIGVPYLLFILIAQIRVTYPFYMLLFIPSQCILSALALSRLPRGVMLTFCVGVLAWFFYGFPRNPLAPWSNSPQPLPIAEPGQCWQSDHSPLDCAPTSVSP
jgi:hypothetical protein